MYLGTVWLKIYHKLLHTFGASFQHFCFLWIGRVCLVISTLFSYQHTPLNHYCHNILGYNYSKGTNLSSRTTHPRKKIELGSWRGLSLAESSGSPDSGSGSPDSGSGSPDTGSGSLDSGSCSPDSGSGSPDSGSGSPESNYQVNSASGGVCGSLLSCYYTTNYQVHMGVSVNLLSL